MRFANKCQLKVKSITCYYFCSMFFRHSLLLLSLHILLLFIHSCDIIVIYCCTHDDDGVVIYMAQVSCTHTIALLWILYYGNYGFWTTARCHTHTQVKEMQLLYIFYRIVQFHAVYSCIKTAVFLEARNHFELHRANTNLRKSGWPFR